MGDNEFGIWNSEFGIRKKGMGNGERLFFTCLERLPRLSSPVASPAPEAS